MSDQALRPQARGLQRAFRRRGRMSAGSAWRQPLAMIGIALLVAWLIVMVTAPLVAPYGPLEQIAGRLEPPSAAHPFGTDQVGRDVLSRVIFAARTSIPFAVLLVVLSLLVGGTLGLVAGYLGGWIDDVVMRAADLVFAFPPIILAMAIAATLGPSIQNAMFALLIVSWPGFARIVRSLVLAAREADYVQAARLLGGSHWRILRVDVLRNVMGPVLVVATVDVGYAILLLSGLSFLGLGIRPPTADWGAMVSEGTNHFEAWWLGTFPGLAIFTVVLGFNFLGDSLRDLLDPRTRER